MREKSFGRELGTLDPLGSGQEGEIEPQRLGAASRLAPGAGAAGARWLHAPGTALAEKFWVSAGATGTRICPRGSVSIQGLYLSVCAAQREAGMLSAHLECFIP